MSLCAQALATRRHRYMFLVLQHSPLVFRMTSRYPLSTGVENMTLE